MRVPRKPVSGRATLDDVAARANVSAVTASRVLRKPEMVSDELRERVNRAVRDLAYVPNQMASALASSRTGRIGVIVPSLTNGVFGEFLRAIHDVFVPAGFQVIMLNSNYMSGLEETAISAMLGQFPEAIILTGLEQTGQARRALVRSGIPVIQTLELTDDPIDICIGLSHEQAGYEAARYLIGLGHRHLATISAPHDARSEKRLAGFDRAAAEQGLATWHFASDLPSSVQVGSQLLTELAGQRPEVTAVFCGNDNLALGALFECQRREIEVPGRLSIVGFNDLETSACAAPSITSIATPRYEMGRQASEIILRIVRGDGSRPAQRTINLGFDLIERESSAGPKAR
jgi:LacI family transcriptional regulator, gluconate utilization system Gnt-I transcriptional repressor